MNTLTREERMKNIRVANLELLPELLQDIVYRRNKVRIGSVLVALASRARVQGLYEYFINGSASLCRQNFYLASRLTLESVGQDGGASFEIGRDILIALLSDNAGVIDAIADVETPELIGQRDDPLASRFYVYMLRLAIRGEDGAVRTMIEKVAKHGKKPWRTECAEGRDFFSLLIKRDKAGLEDRIRKKCSSMKSQDSIDDEFMSYTGTLEAKLSWYRGIRVEIDHPLVPMELMPVQFLDHYDDVYDFLKPGWVPPPQGLVGRVSRWFKT